MAIFDFITDQFILKGITQGLSGNAIQKALTANGLGVRRTDLLSRIAQLSNVPQRASVLRFVPNGAYPGQDLFTVGGSYQTKPYLYTVRMDVVDNVTGERRTMWRQISSSDVLTPGEAKEAAEDNISTADSNHDVTVDTQALETVFVRQDLANI